MTLTKRVIPCLDVANGRVVKGLHFKSIKDAGDPVSLAEKYSNEGADELVFLDITASEENREIIKSLVSKVARVINIPFTVGGGVVNVLQKNGASIQRRTGVKIEVILAGVRDIKQDRICDTSNIKLTEDPFEVVNHPEIDVVLELIGGTGVTKKLVETAIKNGKHVITANKALIAKHGNKLIQLANKNKVRLLFEASVAGGIPIIKSLEQGLSANKIESLAGIINGTGNFILTEMKEKNRDFDDVLKEAQVLGYAEADPTFDVEGIDAAQKLAILAAIAFGTELQFDKVFTKGISNITTEDIKYASELGYTIKHLGIAKRVGNGIELRVHPTLISSQELIANVNGVMNAVLVKGDALGTSLYYGAGAGEEATASSVIADLIDIINNQTSNHILGWKSQEKLTVIDTESIDSEFYLRLLVSNMKGVLAKITGIFHQYNVSIEELIQKQIDENNKGLARELARMNLTLNTYTQWYWKTDLLNLMNFLRLRADQHAQYEIRAYADIMLDTLKKWVPTTYEAFMDYRVGGTEVSAKGKIVLQKLIKGDDINVEQSGLSKREWNELMITFNLKDKLI